MQHDLKKRQRGRGEELINKSKMETDWVYPDALSLLLLLYLQNQHTHTHIHACMHTMISMAIKQTVNFDILRKSHVIITFMSKIITER